MRTFSSIILGLIVAIALVGCDSNEDDLTDAEIFVGNWTLVSISDAEGDQTQGFAGLAESLDINFTADGEFTLLLDYREDSGRQDLPLQGTYELNEGANTLVLNIAAGPSPPFTYDIENEDEISLSSQAEIVNTLFNPTTPYEGTVRVVIRRV